MKDVIAIVELGGRKTVTVTDIVFVLNRVSLLVENPVLNPNEFSSKGIPYMVMIRHSPAAVDHGLRARQLSMVVITSAASTVSVEHSNGVWDL